MVFTTEARRPQRGIYLFVYREIPIDENNPGCLSGGVQSLAGWRRRNRLDLQIKFRTEYFCFSVSPGKQKSFLCVLPPGRRPLWAGGRASVVNLTLILKDFRSGFNPVLNDHFPRATPKNHLLTITGKIGICFG